MMPDLTALHQALAGVVLGGRDLTEVLTEIVGIARRAMLSAGVVDHVDPRGESIHRGVRRADGDGRGRVAVPARVRALR
jgi:hypothetical protein